MPTIEPLESRRLFAASGLDRHFGDGDGRVELGSRYSVLSVAGSAGAVYALVANTATKQQFIYKYDDKGHVDRTFGSFGAALLAFRTPVGLPADAAKIAVDKRSGAIYVGSTGAKLTPTVARATLQVERFTADGKADADFGDGGVYAYSTQLPLNPGATATFTLGRLVPLVHGRLLIAMDTTQSTDNADGSMFRLTGFSDLQLQRLKYDGRRDPGFGHHGVAVVNTGTFHQAYGEHGGYTDTTAAAFGDVQLLDDGRYRVIDTRETASRMTSEGGQATYSTVTSTRYVDSSVINRDGTLSIEIGTPDDPSDAVPDPLIYSKVLTRLTTKNATVVREFLPVQAVASGTSGVTVIGLLNDSTTIRINPGEAVRLTVTRTTRSTPAALDLPKDAVYRSIARSDDGTTFVSTTAGTTAFDASLDLDRTWNKTGTTPGEYAAYFPDDDGRLLFTYPDGFGRLDGV